MGIARLASQGTPLDEGHGVEYFTIAAKTILSKCDAPRMPFQWTINPYRGCEFACTYCYARYTHEFMEMRDGADFERKIFAKQNCAWLLRQELKKVKPGQGIAIGTATDPYQPAERRYEITRSIMAELSLHSGLDIGVVTKSPMVLRDADLLLRIAAQNSLAIHLTVTTVNSDLARLLEVRAPRPDLRLETVKKLNALGINSGVICAPVLPGITDAPADLEALVQAAAQAGARYIFANPLFLKPCAQKMFMPFLAKNFPHLTADYEQRYCSSAYVTEAYRRHICGLVEELCRKYGLPPRDERRRIRTAESLQAGLHQQQLGLFLR